MKFVVLTVGHARFDVRIWHKQIRTLAGAGIPVTYEVSDGEGNEVVDGIEIRDLASGLRRPGALARLSRMWRAFVETSAKRGDILHFHDGFFLPIAILLALRGRRVVYDVHEDYPKQVLEARFGKRFSILMSRVYSVLEWVGGRVFVAIVGATPVIAAKFPSEKTVLVQNFPLLQELVSPTFVPFTLRPPAFAYVGGASKLRGICQVVDAMAELGCPEARMEVAGSFVPASLQDDLSARDGWKYLTLHGWIDRPQLAGLLGRVRAGIVTFLPAPNHVNSQPNKLFEYMAAGIPVIASHFPLWREIIEKARCGIVVDPIDPSSIARAMKWVLDNPAEAEAMGARGRKAIEEIYNWDAEAVILLDLYRQRLQPAQH